ncbi:activator of 90 kDa heat shock protein ATPase homolog 1-like [Biomphalaria glabrata]|uniref:Activator of 90 kDa heat shock protein ATPase homolog 1-like n=2 Tax=Biomphalaria glabrata TaxID=6526 RepID=A0A9W3A052_BIOGL|nr:activator of 90 kDa heat shock protein ATPase homolog 1-like [Biomphalaria glabrata]KAI8747099.1 activator of 90 kDa heat shock protein ATPase-like protein 1 [Biomphalaria glabrata]
MAKWGEGDPRWIVEDRPDATNVNNWHWVEKNATNWSKDRIKELLLNLKVEHEKGTCEIKEITSIEGEASANNRKAKLIFFYEFEIKGVWSGILKDDVKSYKGQFVIPNLSEENDASEIDVNVTADKSCNEAHELKDIFRVEGAKLIRTQLEKYITDLKTEYGQNIILPTKNSDQTKTQTAQSVSNKEIKPKVELNKFVTSETSKPSDVGVRIHTKTLTMTETFQCQSSDLYRALTFKPMVEAYMGSGITFDATKGERFSLAGGNIVGDFVELIPDQKLVMRWRVKTWPPEHYSQVTIELSDKEGTTTLNLKQTGVPEAEVTKTKEGWKENYWNRMRQIFGFGGRIF